jgi:hypothetical protein
MQGIGIDAKKYNAAGKGAAPRKGAQNEKYRENYDLIFSKKRTNDPEKENGNGEK